MAGKTVKRLLKLLLKLYLWTVIIDLLIRLSRLEDNFDTLHKWAMEAAEKGY